MIWDQKTSLLRADRPATNVLGAIAYVAWLLSDNQKGRRLLLIFTDGRQTTNGINFEKLSEIDSRSILPQLRRRHLIPKLQAVEVFLLGVHMAGKDHGYIHSLREFYVKYFEEAEAVLRGFWPTEKEWDTYMELNSQR